jgi:hypothetical protein
MDPKRASLKKLHVSFRDESIQPYSVSLSRSVFGGYTKEIEVKLPPGDELKVYVEVHEDNQGAPDVSLYISDHIEHVVALRCSSGVIVTYRAKCGYECLFQVGSGPWE